MRDLNTLSVDQAEKIIRGTARSMGIDVVEGSPAAVQPKTT
jgi:ribosomal protein L11